MIENLQNFLALPVPVWVLASVVYVAWHRDRETQEWITQIAQAVAKIQEPQKY